MLLGCILCKYMPPTATTANSQFSYWCDNAILTDMSDTIECRQKVQKHYANMTSCWYLGSQFFPCNALIIIITREKATLYCILKKGTFHCRMHYFKALLVVILTIVLQYYKRAGSKFLSELN